MMVFTNGCFDILHPGHVDLLNRAKALGSKLIVGINSDASIRKIKGSGRPIVSENDRAAVLLGLKAVDEVLFFEEPTPEKLIHRIRPDILVKGGDWAANEIIGSDFVTSYGGRVFSIPLLDGYSSSAIVEKIEKPGILEADSSSGPAKDSLSQHIKVFEAILRFETDMISDCADRIIETFRGGGKVLLCGNGGSAADAQHIAAEFIGRYETERRSLPAIALTTDTSALTALANDYDFERVFSRQIDGLAQKGDCLIAISTSGNSPNVIAAVMAARKKGCRVVGMTGKNGKKLAALCDASILIPSERTARVQEAHIAIAHIWCEMVDRAFAED